MQTYPHERIALFVDAPNLSMALNELKWEIDYLLLLKYFAKHGVLTRGYYYTAVDDTHYSSMKPLHDVLTYNGWTVVTKPVKEMTNQGTGRVTRKGNMDVEIAVDMLTKAEHLEHLVLFSGDGDFRRLVECLQDRGKRVTVVSTLAVKVMADELRRQADNFVDLEELKLTCARDPNARVRAGIGINRKTQTAEAL